MNKGINKGRLVFLILVFIGIGGYYYYQNNRPQMTKVTSEVLNASSKNVPNASLEEISNDLNSLGNINDVLFFDEITIEKDLNLDKEIL